MLLVQKIKHCLQAFLYFSHTFGLNVRYSYRYIPIHRTRTYLPYPIPHRFAYSRNVRTVRTTILTYRCATINDHCTGTILPSLGIGRGPYFTRTPTTIRYCMTVSTGKKYCTTALQCKNGTSSTRTCTITTYHLTTRLLVVTSILYYQQTNIRNNSSHLLNIHR